MADNQKELLSYWPSGIITFRYSNELKMRSKALLWINNMVLKVQNIDLSSSSYLFHKAVQTHQKGFS